MFILCGQVTWNQEFENVKEAIANTTKLTHFDPNKPVVIETDASLKGLGAVLIQDGKPVKYLSKSLTQTESDYSNIERELLAVLFACEKLHIYVFGRPITIHTDHQPLEIICQKPISLAPARLQRMLLRLRTYTLQVKYVGAKSMLIADTLSRLVKPGTNPAVPDLNITISQVLKIRPTRIESLQDEIKADPALSPLCDYIINGWPDSVQNMQETLRPYWCFRDELTILDRACYERESCSSLISFACRNTGSTSRWDIKALVQLFNVLVIQSIGQTCKMTSTMQFSTVMNVKFMLKRSPELQKDKCQQSVQCRSLVLTSWNPKEELLLSQWITTLDF